MAETEQILSELAADEPDPQRRIDALNARVVALRQRDLAAAFTLNRQVEALISDGQPYLQGQIDCYYWRGKLHMMEQRLPEALVCFLHARALCEHRTPLGESGYWFSRFARHRSACAIDSDAPDQFLHGGVGLAALYNVIGAVLGLLEQFDEALASYLAAERLAIEDGDTHIQALLANNIGYLYSQLDRYDEAHAMLTRGRDLSDQLPQTLAFKRLYANTTDNLSFVLHRMGRSAEGLALATEAHTIYLSIGWPQGIAEVANVIAQCHAALGAQGTALAWLAIAYRTAHALDLAAEMAIAKHERARIFLARGELERARRLAIHVVAIADRDGVRKLQYTAHELLSQIDEQRGDFRSALAHHRQFHAIKEQVFSEASDRRMKVLSVLHEVDAARSEAAQQRQRSVTLEREIAARERTMSELEIYATIDTLTGALNRRKFFTTAEQILQRAAIHGENVGVLLFDLDFFKHINDTHGHPVGDTVLRAVAAATRTVLRSEDIVGRYGGEEFIVALPQTTPHQALQIAERLRLNIAELTIALPPLTIGVTISIGLALTGPSADSTLDALIARADRALYAAKQLGRNRTEIAA